MLPYHVHLTYVVVAKCILFPFSILGGTVFLIILLINNRFIQLRVLTSALLAQQRFQLGEFIWIPFFLNHCYLWSMLHSLIAFVLRQALQAHQQSKLSAHIHSNLVYFLFSIYRNCMTFLSIDLKCIKLYFNSQEYEHVWMFNFTNAKLKVFIFHKKMGHLIL